MNVAKPLIFVASLSIACAGFAGIVALTDNAAHAVQPAAVAAEELPVTVLPVTVVHPGPADYQRTFGPQAKGNVSARTRGAGIDMPYYSFAGQGSLGSR